MYALGLFLFPWRSLSDAFPRPRAVSRLLRPVPEEARMRWRIAAFSIIPVAAVAAAAPFGIAGPSGPQMLAQGGRPAATPVDVEVVLAVDVSYSMDPDEQQLQREGYMAAITSREFLRA